MKMNFYKKFAFLSAVLLVSLAFSATAFAYGTPIPNSGGKFFKSKGTKSDQAYEYEGRPGGPAYEYGKGLLVGPVLVKPAMEYSARWENNVFYDENGRKQDWVHLLRPGVRAELPLGGGQHLLTAEYDAEISYFQRYGDVADHTNHIVAAGLELNFVPFTLSLSDTFNRSVSRGDTEFTSRIERDENTFDALLEIPFAQFFLETEINDYDIDYSTVPDSVFDYHNFNIYQRVGVDVGPQTQFLVEYGYGNIYYYHANDERDGDYHQAMIGLRGLLTERLTYQIWGGSQWRIYDDAVRPDFNGFVSRGSLKFDINELQSLSLNVDRTPQESTFDGQSYYVRNRGTLSYKHQIAERLFLGLDAALTYNEYSRITNRNGQDRTRRDYPWETGAGLEYFMPNQIVSFFGEYRYKARESDLDGLSYDSQSVNMGVRARY